MNSKIDSKTMFASMEPWHLFFKVAMPGMVSMFAMSVYSIIEGIFIGQKLGEEAFAAINIALPVVMFNFSLSDLVGVGASVPISISLGRKDEENANNVFTCSVILIFLVSVLMGLVMFFAAEPIASFMGASGGVLDCAARYIKIFALTSPVTAVCFAMDNYLRISGYIKTSMVINIFTNVLIVILLWVFLFCFDMDVTGSALASVISLCAASFVEMIPFIRGKALLKFRKPRFTVSMIKEIGANGSPVFLNNIAGRIASVMMNISLVTLGVKYLGEGGGTTAVATYAVLMYSSDMCQPLLYGMSDSLSPAIGFNFGAENYDRVKKIAKCGYIGNAAVSVLSTFIMFFFSKQLTALFVDPENLLLTELASDALKIFCFAYLIRWFIISAQNFLSAVEKPIHATVLSVAVAFVFPAVMLLALRPLGLNGIWLNMLGTSVLSAILGIFLVHHVMSSIKKKG